MDRARRKSVIAIYYDVNISLDLAKHRLDHEPFALSGFGNYSRAGCPRTFHCAVGGVVVKDVNLRLRKFGPK
jgi:hypothetical protein